MSNIDNYSCLISFYVVSFPFAPSDGFKNVKEFLPAKFPLLLFFFDFFDRLVLSRLEFLFSIPHKY